MTAIQFTLESRNAKVGRMPVSTTSSDTCPDACPLKRNGCYAEQGPLGWMWKALNKATPGETFKRGRDTLQSLTWSQFVKAISQLPEGTLWRHNQAGDLPGQSDQIDTKALTALVNANRGKRGFTYTHKPLTRRNRAALENANANGFTVNLSADNLTEADELADTGMPTVVVLPDTAQGNVDIFTSRGRRIVVCPATYRDNVSCKSCQLCQRSNRKIIVGFPAHGAAKRKASNIANS